MPEIVSEIHHDVSERASANEMSLEAPGPHGGWATLSSAGAPASGTAPSSGTLRGKEERWDLADDCTEAQAVEMLLSAQGVSRFFRGFSTPEVHRLSELMNFLALSAGEEVLVKGERATFFAVVMTGRVDILAGECPPVRLLMPPTPIPRMGRLPVESVMPIYTKVHIPMYKGETVGELTYFCGGHRTATCRCATF